MSEPQPTNGLISGLRARFTRRATAQDSAITAAALRSDRFRQVREADWKRLEQIVTRMEAGRLSRLSDADVLDLPVLYRTLASSLSIARETSLDAATIAYLESLAQRAWFLVYGPRVGLWGWLRRFFGGEWSRAVRAIGLDIAIAFGVMVAGTVVGWLLVARDPGWYGALASLGPGDTRVPGASRAVLRATLYGHSGENALSVFATYLFGHNAQIAILAFALGFLLGIPSLLLLVQNTGNLGAILWLYHGQGLTLDLAGWLAVHGTTELSAILLSGAAGLHIGRAIAFPGERGLLASAAFCPARAALVMTGVVLMLLVAAMLEGFARQLIDSTAIRLGVGLAMLALWWGYFALAGRGRGRGENGDG